MYPRKPEIVLLINIKGQQTSNIGHSNGGRTISGIDQVPSEYAEFIPIMTTEASLELPEHDAYDHAIDIKDETKPPLGPIYPLNETEFREQ